MERVATFVRASFHSNAYYTIQVQSKNIKDYCEAHGYDISDSALAVGNRKKALQILKSLLQSAAEKGITKVVMATANRICGSVEEIEELNASLNASGMTIETLDDTYENTPDPGSLVASSLSQASLETEETFPDLKWWHHFPKLGGNKNDHS